MGTRTERSNSLHNFTMPRELRWGNQRFLRCLKVNSDGRVSPLSRFAAKNSDQRRGSDCALPSRGAGYRKRERGREIDSWSEFMHGSRKLGLTSPPATDCGRRFSGYDDEIAATRERVILDLQTAADEMKHAIFKDGRRPWNLRTRRADLDTPLPLRNVDVGAGAGGENGSAGGKGKSNLGESQTKAGLAAAIDKPMKLRSGGAATAKERPKFSVALSKTEIEEDFYSMAGRRPPRRPKKRARNVQRQFDALFPGLWLSEVTPDMYKVSEDEAR